MAAVFRDHAMSDGVGFNYQRMDPRAAADDLLGKVIGIRDACAPGGGDRPPLIPVILDGENCWEYYPDGGVGFLRQLYREAARRDDVVPTTVAGYLENHPPTDRVDRLFAGSWINHDFYIWIGHREDRDGWDRLHETRAFLTETEEAGGADPAALKQAWEEIYIAEGSDWFWWYGDDRSSGQDELFDDLFRRHLRNVYKLLGGDPPANLDVPITDAEPKQTHTVPTGFVGAVADGRRTYFEWISAGKYEASGDRGTMAAVTEGLIREAYFGFDLTPQTLEAIPGGTFCLRLDTAGDAGDDLAGVDGLRVRFQRPEGVEVRVPGLGPDSDGPTPAVFIGDERRPDAAPVAAAGPIFELVVPLADLGVSPGDPVHFAVEAVKGDASEDRAPREGVIRLDCPTADFELELWQA